MNTWTMSKALDFLKANEAPASTTWRDEANWRRDNEFWLRYSRHITLRVLISMDEQSITQVDLARRMGCSQQYVSNLLKGSSNMTLETIARLEQALNLDIIKSVLTPVSGYDYVQSPRHQYLSEPESPGYGSHKD